MVVAMKFQAAIRDSVTGRVFTGESHADVVAKVFNDSTTDTDTRKRIIRAQALRSKDTGFVGPDGTFISRDEAKAKYGFSTLEEMKEIYGGAQ